MRRISLIHKAVLAAVFSLWLASAASAATIILVRHAERSDAMSADSPISPAGEERARELARVLKDAGVRRIYVTELRRTQQTAAPLAASLNLKPVILKLTDTARLVEELRKLGEDETVLVVGHSNTIPLIIEGLGAGKVAAIGDTEYDRMTVVTSLGNKTRVLTLRYGGASR